MTFCTYSTEFQNLASDIGNALLRMSNQTRGSFTVICNQVGTFGFNRVDAYYKGQLVMQMLESWSGDYDYLISFFTNDINILTELVLTSLYIIC